MLFRDITYSSPSSLTRMSPSHCSPGNFCTIETVPPPLRFTGKPKTTTSGNFRTLDVGTVSGHTDTLRNRSSPRGIPVSPGAARSTPPGTPARRPGGTPKKLRPPEGGLVPDHRSERGDQCRNHTGTIRCLEQDRNSTRLPGATNTEHRHQHTPPPQHTTTPHTTHKATDKHKNNHTTINTHELTPPPHAQNNQQNQPEQQKTKRKGESKSLALGKARASPSPPRLVSLVLLRLVASPLILLGNRRVT